ncbi:MAG: hypothetical protein HYT87_08010 [Nitrospirae bacterium]|nr:hypothetical protein [Nitrospirota bacterium]
MIQAALADQRKITPLWDLGCGAVPKTLGGRIWSWHATTARVRAGGGTKGGEDVLQTVDQCAVVELRICPFG